MPGVTVALRLDVVLAKSAALVVVTGIRMDIWRRVGALVVDKARTDDVEEEM